MKIEQHEEAFEEHLRNIERAIDEGIEKNQRNLGFNLSQGSVELFSIFLHKLNLIRGSGDQLDHRIFKSTNLISKKLPFDFPDRKKILALMNKIESQRIALCYGSRKIKFRIEETLKNFQDLRKLINKEIKNATE